MAKKPIGIIKSIRNRLNEGYQVILKKDSDGVHPTSFSRVVRMEGNSIRRTAFDALSTNETYDYKPGKYTVEHIEENERIHFFGTGKMLTVQPSTEPCGCLCDDEDDDDYDDEEFFDDDFEEEDDELDDGNCLLQEQQRTAPRKPSRLKRIVL